MASQGAAVSITNYDVCMNDEFLLFFDRNVSQTGNDFEGAGLPDRKVRALLVVAQDSVFQGAYEKEEA